MPWFYCRPVNVSFLFCAAKAEVEITQFWRSALLGVRPLQAVNTPSLKEQIEENKLASLEATLVRNSAHPLTHLLTHRGKV